MTPQIPASEPTTITAGDTVQFTRTFPSYSSSDGWALTYRLVGPLGSSTGALVDKTVTATPDASGWLVAFAPADTADVVVDGSYRLVGRVSLNGASYTVYAGVVAIKANPLEASPANLLTHAERTLTIIEAKIEGRLTADLEHYQIDGRAVGKIEIRELMKLRARYRHEIWRQRNPGKAAPQRLVRFR